MHDIFYSTLVLRAWNIWKDRKSKGEQPLVRLAELEEEFSNYKLRIFSMMEWAMATGVVHATSENGISYYFNDEMLSVDAETILSQIQSQYVGKER